MLRKVLDTIQYMVTWFCFFSQYISHFTLSLSLRACLLYLTPKMRTFSSWGSGSTGQDYGRRIHPTMDDCSTVWVAYWFSCAFLLLHGTGCHAHRTTPFLLTCSKEINRNHGTHFSCGPSHVPQMCVCSHCGLCFKVANLPLFVVVCSYYNHDQIRIVYII